MSKMVEEGMIAKGPKKITFHGILLHESLCIYLFASILELKAL